ncbi:MAG: YeeE/YedE family protein [Gammaproteobacteria bacterium]|nr:YeeE/YedE family protein [Gammaproteobacteria bacterium]
MVFENFFEGQSVLIWSGFVIALILGAVVNKTNFCTMGAVSDLVNIGDTGRMRAWVFAMAVAMIGVTIMEMTGLTVADNAFPPYRAAQLIWAENLLGGIMFGIGMTLASGCGNKTLVRIGGGNLKSIVVFAIIAVIAFYMINPFPGSDKTLFSELFYGWIRPLAIDLGRSQDLGTLVAGKESGATARTAVGFILGIALLAWALKSTDFRKSFDNVLGGLVVGLAVLGAWYVSSAIHLDIDGEVHTLRSYVENWDFLADSAAGKPAAFAPLSSQSYTFINPIGQTYGWIKEGFDGRFATFGIMAVLGVIAGSFLWSIISKGFRIEWFANLKDFMNHFIGAILMGFGGVLAMGCTIGQGITGISTLALGSFIAFIGITFGSAMTMKIQLYKMVYEDEATFGKAFITGLVDFKLLPKSMRKLDAV